MKFELFLTIEERDKKGRWISRKKSKSNSLVLAFIDLLAAHCGNQVLNIPDFAGTSRSINITTLDFLMTGGVGTITSGIRVGTGTNAVALDNYGLQTYIAHGTGGGELSHGANSVSAPSTSGTSRQFTVSRTFTNNTASDITVNEVALQVSATNVSYYLVIDRTRSTFTIAAGASKTVTYTVKITV